MSGYIVYIPGGLRSIFYLTEERVDHIVQYHRNCTDGQHTPLLLRTPLVVFLAYHLREGDPFYCSFPEHGARRRILKHYPFIVGCDKFGNPIHWAQVISPCLYHTYTQCVLRWTLIRTAILSLCIRWDLVIVEFAEISTGRMKFPYVSPITYRSPPQMVCEMCGKHKRE